MSDTRPLDTFDVLLGTSALAFLGGVAWAAHRSSASDDASDGALNATSSAPGSPSPKAWNAYATWVLFAIIGRLAEADAIMRAHRPDIEAVARYLQARAPVEPRLLYRGLFLDPREVRDGFVKPDTRVGSVSFSEDRGVACWFADRDSSISGEVARMYPSKRGYLVEHTPDVQDVLFHHTWHELPGSPYPPGADLTTLARRTPALAPLADQFDWALRTQAEVIVKPMRVNLRVTPIADAGCDDTESLERRLGPDFHWRPG